MDVERTFTVRQPVRPLFDYLKDFANTEVWDPGTVTCTRVGIGPIEAGAQWHNVSEFRGRRTELTYRLFHMEETRLIFVGKNKTATATDDLAFTAVPDGTTITYHATIVFNGIARLADPFLKPGFNAVADNTVAQMVAVLNAL
ncbi:SRPBCC family protein [Fodinicola feengrottensis]|uniref:SRPBCC family protein n=1 Tax=Fodinicola feengrottensis TaxID=435914 RepID=A0ABP4SHQ8_9ACTN|nr:SRPBCC family protein [Fodinicola feengrottensis]